MNKSCQEVVLLSEADKTIHFVSGYITGHGGTGTAQAVITKIVTSLCLGSDWLREELPVLPHCTPASTPYTMLHLHTTRHTAFCCRRKLFPFILLLNMCTVLHPSTWELSGVDSAHLHSITHLMHISSWISFTFHDVISANRKSILNSKCWTPSHN